jgi:hypothetical protein
MTLQVSCGWHLWRAIATDNISLRSGSVAADAGGAGDPCGPGRAHATETGGTRMGGT